MVYKTVFLKINPTSVQASVMLKDGGWHHFLRTVEEERRDIWKEYSENFCGILSIKIM